MGNHGGFDLDGMSSLTKCIFSSPPHMENGSLGGLKTTDALEGGATIPHLVCAALHGIGLWWDLQSS